MTPSEQWYRELLRRLTGVYEDAVDITVSTEGNVTTPWNDFRDAVAGIFKWADVVQAAKLRWRGRRQKIEVPGVDRKDFDPLQHELSIEDVLSSNEWAQTHAQATWPLIEQQATIVAQIEQEFAEKRAAAIRNDPEAIPLYRLEMLYRNTIGEVLNVSEQVELSTPEINDAFPYSEYKSRDDFRVRSTHRAMHGFIALREGEGLRVLEIVRPKNGYNCRCYLVHRAWFEAVDRGWAKAIGKPKWELKWPNSAARHNFENGLFPDPGWDRKKFVASAA